MKVDLPDPRRTHQEDELALADVYGHVAQGHHVALEHLGDLLHLDHEHPSVMWTS